MDRVFCQRALVIVGALLFLSPGCMKRAVKEVLPPVDAVPVWFRIDERFSDTDKDEKPFAHPFFDLTHFGHPQDNSINFYPLIPVGSSYSYGLDLISGRRYRKQQLCQQRDVWEKYPRVISGPPYTEGIVPRLLDPVGLPQKIIVFGRANFYRQHDMDSARSFRVRVVGGLVEQYCSHYPCSGAQERWLTRPVLVGVDTEENAYSQITSLDQLKKKEDWDYVMAYAQNEGGRTITPNEHYPAYRIIREISAPKALAYVLSRGHTFTFEEMKSLRLQCNRLGDYLWGHAQKIREFQDNPELIKERNKTAEDKIKDLKANVVKQVVEEKMPAGVTQANFARFFEEFVKKFGQDYRTCSKYVRMGNITQDPERFWFFVYMDAFFDMDRLGYVYDCSRRVWALNPYKLDAKRDVDFAHALHACSTEQLDRAFNGAVHRQSGLFQNDLEHYRFVEYDNGPGGTHQKIYSWVHSTGRPLGCLKNEVVESKEKAQIFPEDVEWKPFFKIGGHEDLKIRR